MQYLEKLKEVRDTLNSAGPDVSITLDPEAILAIKEYIDFSMEEITGLVAQGCTMSDKTLDSCCISSYASSLRLLAAFGLVDIKELSSKRVLGKWKH